MERLRGDRAASHSNKHSPSWHANQMLPQNWIASSVKLIPTRALSRAWGYLSRKRIPIQLRPLIYSMYGMVFGVNSNEVELPLAEYPTLASFFRRRLKEEARVISEDVDMVSPVDGRVLALGQVRDGQYIDQVKGCKFSIEQFLGSDAKTLMAEQRRKSQCPKHVRLFYAVIYLGPGDYHGVHSAVDWSIDEARHVPGHLLSVSPMATRLIRSVLTINERLALNGHWKHGFFSMTCVGAFNVGSITLEFDEQLRTNLRDSQYSKIQYEGIAPTKGQCVAFFEFGSTVVLLFEAPDLFQFSVQEKDRVRVGQAIGHVRV